ncbi:diguanylate cyclase [Desulfobacterota bacterium AH_259_B03_O07]|nr:diguanylate cyclase [Desulfobacterota bacterium AH_259_B03_O07]
MSENNDSRLVNTGNKFIIRTLEQGHIEHSKWIKDWLRSLLCGLPINEVYLSKDGHFHCDFGKWYYNQFSPFFSNNEDFLLINKIHLALHERARVLALKVKLRDTITKEEYDDFIETEKELSTLLLKLKNEIHETIIDIDFLTGLPTRQPFFEILSQELSRALRTAQPCFITMVDIDHLKNINDKYGHLSGDTALKATAKYLNNNLRPYDSICRYGGDEFLICLPNATMHVTKKILNRLQLGLASLPITIYEEKIINITASFGAAKVGPDTSIDDIIASADNAMYAAKRGGRNQFGFWENND